MAALTVGAGQRFATLAGAVAASKDGDTIYVEAGTYLSVAGVNSLAASNFGL